MGRLKKYNTVVEQQNAQRKWAKQYYWKNKTRLDEKAKEAYRKKTGKDL